MIQLCCGCLLELSRCNDSNEQPHHAAGLGKTVDSASSLVFESAGSIPGSGKVFNQLSVNGERMSTGYPLWFNLPKK